MLTASTGGGAPSTARRPRAKRLRRAAAHRPPSPRRLGLDEAALATQHAPPIRHRGGRALAAAAAFIDGAASASEEDEEEDDDEEGSGFESSFVDDASQPCPATDARGGRGGGGYGSQPHLRTTVRADLPAAERWSRFGRAAP